MRTIIPKKLSKGSHIRVIAPSRSAAILSKELVINAKKALELSGFRVSFGNNINEIDEFLSSRVSSRVADLHEAFVDKNVDGILTAIGGYNSNQLLSQIDYDIIRNNPKVLCGYSDITALSNAIYAKTGLVTYSGPHFSSWGMKQGFEFSRELFMECVTSDTPFVINPSKTWSDDLWFMNQDERTHYENNGPIIVNKGWAQGTIIGGHVRCLASLQGTEFWPKLKNCILFLEEDEETNGRIFDRLVQSIIHQKDFGGVKGVVIGRFQKESGLEDDSLIKLLKAKPELNDMPVIINVNIGHTTPIATYPVGGSVDLDTLSDKPIINVTKH